MYIYFGTRSIIVCSENVTIQNTKYITEDRFSVNLLCGFEGQFLSYTALWKVYII